MNNVEPLPFHSAGRMRNAWISGLSCVIALAAAGCAYSEKQPLIKAEAPPDRLLEIATDPLRPLQERLAGARSLDAQGRRELETALLQELPDLWGLEWRERLSILAVVGSESAVDALEQMNSRGELPSSERAQSAMRQTIRAIEARLDVSPTPASAGS